MESFFNTSFADVRVHVGPEAPSIGALAFTHGPDLYFAPGQYNPQTTQGQQLLGHELTHVVQQRAGRVRNPLGSGIAVVQDVGLEAEAERMGQQAATQPAQVQPRMQNAVGSGIAGFPTPSGLNTGNGSATPKTVASPVDRSGSVQRAATASSRGMAQAPIVPSKPQLGRAPVQMRQAGNRSPIPPGRLNRAAIQPMVSALRARLDATKPTAQARPGLVQAKGQGQGQVTLPASSGAPTAIQRAKDWTKATYYSEDGRHGIRVIEVDVNRPRDEDEVPVQRDRCNAMIMSGGYPGIGGRRCDQIVINKYYSDRTETSQSVSDPKVIAMIQKLTF